MELEQDHAIRPVAEAKLAEASQDRTMPLHPAAFFAELKKCLPRDLYYAWDGGDVVHWGRAMLPAAHAGRWLRLGPLGTIGSALRPPAEPPPTQSLPIRFLDASCFAPGLL